MTVSIASPIICMECPWCGRLWVGNFPLGWGLAIELRNQPHAAALFHGGIYLGYVAGFRSCYGIPERVQRADVEAAYLIGGQDAAETCVDRSLRDSTQRIISPW